VASTVGVDDVDGMGVAAEVATGVAVDVSSAVTLSARTIASKRPTHVSLQNLAVMILGNTSSLLFHCCAIPNQSKFEIKHPKHALIRLNTRHRYKIFSRNLPIKGVIDVDIEITRRHNLF
jgi:hypothetical protein